MMESSGSFRKTFVDSGPRPPDLADANFDSVTEPGPEQLKPIYIKAKGWGSIQPD